MKNMVKIVCLGNEFIEEDSLAKKVGALLSGENDVVNIKDSFELMELVSSGDDFVILDVAEELEDVKKLELEDLRVDDILSAHDFDAAYVLKLLGKDLVKIIGIPMTGDAREIRDEVLRLITT